MPVRLIMLTMTINCSKHVVCTLQYIQVSFLSHAWHTLMELTQTKPIRLHPWIMWDAGDFARRLCIVIKCFGNSISKIASYVASDKIWLPGSIQRMMHIMICTSPSTHLRSRKSVYIKYAVVVDAVRSSPSILSSYLLNTCDKASHLQTKIGAGRIPSVCCVQHVHLTVQVHSQKLLCPTKPDDLYLCCACDCGNESLGILNWLRFANTPLHT